MRRPALYLAGLVVVACATLAACTTPHPAGPPDARQAIAADMRDMLAAYRKIIVLTAGQDAMPPPQRELVNRVGKQLFHDNQQRRARIDAALAELVHSGQAGRFEQAGALLSEVGSDPALHDADRLAFRETLAALYDEVAGEAGPQAVRLHKRLAQDLQALDDIERAYDKELHAAFDPLGQAMIAPRREKWDSYVAWLASRYRREDILKEAGVQLPPAQPTPAEIFGTRLPPKTVALTFDDGPHRVYSEQIAAILAKYKVPAVFFTVGQNIGSIGKDGAPHLNGGADISRKLRAAGYVLGNHSMTHAQLTKLTGERLKAEILDTDLLLRTLDPQRSILFRFPYGDRNAEGKRVVADARLLSVMWNVDSLDWSDPVPASITQRVMTTLHQEGRGIILFHDIHQQTVKALPLVLDRLAAEGYRFAGWDGSDFTVPAGR
ncbi:polysaccharide deacetylase family protein [Massilia agilis]|uniref:Polysaccharide deacetylase family protein n=1 Tax=Massilia agilis TaxID=1811226 RepID=A0ABT2DEX9_9BURK|nr:polysaccharide deacetylase family protein [Massilia agilis]MCS0809812.1 polysaccharide deacetylase family protein [Massilia agilis]